MSLPQPFPYQGSKRRLAARICQRMPNSVRRIVEPFAGSAAISIAAIHGGIAAQAHLSDVDAPLIGLLRLIVERPDEVVIEYGRRWMSRPHPSTYDEVRARFNRERDPHDLLYLLARCVKGAVRYNARGEFNQAQDLRRDGRTPTRMEREIRETCRVLSDRTTFAVADYETALDEASPQDLCYLDPPYCGTAARYVQGLGSTERLISALARLDARGVPWILSFDGDEHSMPLPDGVGHRVLIEAGTSAQQTLLGRRATSVESLYVSPGLAAMTIEA